MSPSSTALIVARPGPMRDAWRALFTTLPRLRDIEQVEDAPAALQAVARLHPAVVVVDAALLKRDAEGLLRQIQTLSPETRRVALVESVDQKRALAASAAEMVFLHGSPAPAVAAAIEDLLLSSATRPPPLD